MHNVRYLGMNGLNVMNLLLIQHRTAAVTQVDTGRRQPEHCSSQLAMNNNLIEYQCRKTIVSSARLYSKTAHNRDQTLLSNLC